MSDAIQLIIFKDISTRNILFKENAEGPGPRLLLMDMEFSVQFAPGERAIVDLWDDCAPPPEGLVGIDAYAYDMLCVGYCIDSFVHVSLM